MLCLGSAPCYGWIVVNSIFWRWPCDRTRISLVFIALLAHVSHLNTSLRGIFLWIHVVRTCRSARQSGPFSNEIVSKVILFRLRVANVPPHLCDFSLLLKLKESIRLSKWDSHLCEGYLLFLREVAHPDTSHHSLSLSLNQALGYCEVHCVPRSPDLFVSKQAQVNASYFESMGSCYLGFHQSKTKLLPLQPLLWLSLDCREKGKRMSCQCLSSCALPQPRRSFFRLTAINAVIHRHWSSTTKVLSVLLQ